MKQLAEDYSIEHKLTVAYSPKVNGTVENCMRHMRSACTALLSEFRLGPQDGPLVIDIIMSALNEAPLQRLGTRRDGTFSTPLEFMTGLRPSRNVFKLNELPGK